MSRSRVAGCTIPLFSIRSERDWGIGEIADLPLCAAWLERAGMGLVQLLPAYELAAGETSETVKVHVYAKKKGSSSAIWSRPTGVR